MGINIYYREDYKILHENIFEMPTDKLREIIKYLIIKNIIYKDLELNDINTLLDVIIYKEKNNLEIYLDYSLFEYRFAEILEAKMVEDSNNSNIMSDKYKNILINQTRHITSINFSNFQNTLNSFVKNLNTHIFEKIKNNNVYLKTLEKDSDAVLLVSCECINEIEFHVFFKISDDVMSVINKYYQDNKENIIKDFRKYSHDYIDLKNRIKRSPDIINDLLEYKDGVIQRKEE